MATQISPENEQFITQEVAKGSFRDRREALNAGIELLRSRQQLIDRLKESRRQLDTGQYSEYDAAGLHELFVELKQRAGDRTDSL